MNIKILVDSASDITAVEAKELGVEMIPMEITFESTTYLDGVDITPISFYEKLIESDSLPKTSQINPYRFEEVLDDMTKENDVIVITISSKLSNTYNNALMVSEKYNNVRVIDSLNASVGERLLVNLAIRLVKEGKSLDEIEEILNEQKLRIKVLAAVDTLEYLKKGGRINAATALIGTIFAIKPVIAIIDGEVKVIGKAKGSKRANNYLNQLVEESGGIDFDFPYGTGYAGLSDINLQKYIVDSTHILNEHLNDLPIYMIGSTIGTHVGPGTIGVAFFAIHNEKNSINK